MKFMTLLIIFLFSFIQPSKVEPILSVNGGTDCAYCTIIVTMVEELAIVYNDTVEESLDRLCQFLPEGIFRTTCKQAVELYGPVIINGIYSKENGDSICHTLKFCWTDPGQNECHLLRKTEESISDRAQKLKRKLNLKNINIPTRPGKGICDEPIFKEICDYIKRSFDSHIPAVDIDQDGHSTIQTFRGTSWKGKDCNDFSKSIRPGVKPINGDKASDSNCNGIYGRAPGTNLTYEEMFCKNSNQMGVAVLGDSISAHFSIPEQWVDAYRINSAVFEHLAFIIENEADWPQISTITGFMNSSWPVEYGVTNSVYLKLLEKNRCNFRDYQNVAVNGADTKGMIKIVKSLARNQKEDLPMLVFLSLVGNDVCNGNPDTLNHMTKPDELYNNLIEVLTYLDTVLPNGSHLMLTGLANGSLLYEALKDTVYPLGKVKNDIYYTDFYNYLTCLQRSPCNGWMTTNATLRKLTTDYAMMLSKVIKNITETTKYKNFDMAYTDVPFEKMMEIWEAMGGEKWQLIEPFDGFHINQIGNVLLADLYWDILEKEHPDWLGPDNIHNEQIKKIFGDQGGY